MKFKRLYMQRFMSVGDEPVEIIFPDGGGITQIQGINKDVAALPPANSRVLSNAAGKSTMIEGILFGLTGKVLRGLKLEDCLHDHAREKGMVELEFDNVTIVRTIKPNTVRVFVDGVEKTHKGSKVKTKKSIEEEYVGVNFETMANILVFGQHNVVSFLGATEGDKREIVENLMNLKEYNLYEERAKDKLKEKKSQVKILSEKFTFQNSHLDSQKALREQQYQSYESYRNKIEAEIAAVQLRKAALPNPETIRADWAKYEQFVEESQTLTKKLLDRESLRNASSEKLNTILHDFRAEQNGKAPLAEHLHTIKEKFLRLDAMKRDAVVSLDSIKDAMIQNEREIDRLERWRDDQLRLIKPSHDWDGLMNNMKVVLAQAKEQRQAVVDKKLTDQDVCPTCYGVIDVDNAKKVIEKWDSEIRYQEEIIADTQSKRSEDVERMRSEEMVVRTEFESKLNVCLSEKAGLQTQWENKTKQIDEDYDSAVTRLNAMKAGAEQSIREFETNLQAKYKDAVTEAEKERNDLGQAILQLKEQISKLRQVPKPTFPLEAIGKFEAEANAYTQEITEKQKALAVNPYADIIDKLTTSIAELDKDVQEIEAQLKDAESAIPYYEFWADAMGKEGLKSFIIDQIVPSLNQQIDYWLQNLYRGAISLSFDKYLNTHMVNKASGNEMVFGQGSGSEQRRVDLSIMLSFRDIMKMSTGKDPSIIFFDEVADSLDDDGIYNVYKTIEELSKTCHVYVITHHPTFKQLLENTNRLVFVKEKGATKLM
jgi:DNA repair exonuclease SbcCD ATPase subunit